MFQVRTIENGLGKEMYHAAKQKYSDIVAVSGGKSPGIMLMMQLKLWFEQFGDIYHMCEQSIGG